MNKASEEDCRQHSHLTVPLLCQVRPLLLFAPLSFFNKQRSLMVHAERHAHPDPFHESCTSLGGAQPEAKHTVQSI